MATARQRDGLFTSSEVVNAYSESRVPYRNATEKEVTVRGGLSEGT